MTNDRPPAPARTGHTSLRRVGITLALVLVFVALTETALIGGALTAALFLAQPAGGVRP